MSRYYVHNGYSGWSYGMPSNPQLISPEDAAKLMKSAGLSSMQVSTTLPPAQYAEAGTRLFDVTGGNRFLFFGDYTECFDVDAGKVSSPLIIDWSAV